MTGIYSRGLALVGTFIAILVVAWVLKERRKGPLPPGPKGRWPLLGMTLDMPATVPWKHMAAWAR